MSGLLLGGNDQELAGDDAASAEGLLPMMQQMMKNLLSRDVLYPTMTDIRDKVNMAIFVLFVCALVFVCFSMFPSIRVSVCLSVCLSVCQCFGSR